MIRAPLNPRPPEIGRYTRPHDQGLLGGTLIVINERAVMVWAIPVEHYGPLAFTFIKSVEVYRIDQTWQRQKFFTADFSLTPSYRIHNTVALFIRSNEVQFLCLGGLSYALFISLLISKLFCTKGCMGGGEGERDKVNSLRPARRGRGGEGTIRSLPFQVPKKSRFSGPTPSNGPRNGFCLHQNHYVLLHINNLYINSYQKANQMKQARSFVYHLYTFLSLTIGTI